MQERGESWYRELVKYTEVRLEEISFRSQPNKFLFSYTVNLLRYIIFHVNVHVINNVLIPKFIDRLKNWNKVSSRGKESVTGLNSLLPLIRVKYNKNNDEGKC